MQRPERFRFAGGLRRATRARVTTFTRCATHTPRTSFSSSRVHSDSVYRNSCAPVIALRLRRLSVVDRICKNAPTLFKCADANKIGDLIARLIPRREFRVYIIPFVVLVARSKVANRFSHKTDTSSVYFQLDRVMCIHICTYRWVGEYSHVAFSFLPCYPPRARQSSGLLTSVYRVLRIDRASFDSFRIFWSILRRDSPCAKISRASSSSRIVLRRIVDGLLRTILLYRSPNLNF